MEKKTATKLDETKATVKAAEAKVAAKAQETKTAVKEIATEKKATAEKVVGEAKVTAGKVASKAKNSVRTSAKTTKKETLKPEVYIQFQGNEAVVEEAIEKAKAQYVGEGHRASSIKSLQIYLKPEEYAAYYVINQKVAGRVDLF